MQGSKNVPLMRLWYHGSGFIICDITQDGAVAELKRMDLYETLVPRV
jgi:hypothetical protein